jgi:hypothetical protein
VKTARQLLDIHHPRTFSLIACCLNSSGTGQPPPCYEFFNAIVDCRNNEIGVIEPGDALVDIPYLDIPYYDEDLD